MDIKDFKKLNLPDSPGVYFFKKGRNILYIGKATSLKDRVKSYFGDDLIHTRGALLVDMVTLATTIDFQKTDSVLEAFLLESELIKKHQPYHNTKEKDNKSFNYVVITKEEFPRILVVRGRELEMKANNFRYTDKFGPYPYGSELREALKLVRRIFPYRDTCIPYVQLVKEGKIKLGSLARPCFNKTIGLCPGVCTGEISKHDYALQVNNIRLFFKGKKGKIVSLLKKQMRIHSKKMEFEQAHVVKKTILALEHIQDISMIKRERVEGQNGIRFESYDIAHLSGKDMVGVMVSMQNGEFQKQEYKKFNIKTLKGTNDTAALSEVLTRRMNHAEWAYPNVIVIDGGQGQLNAVEKVLRDIPFKGTLVSVVKDERHKAKDILYSEVYKGEVSKEDCVKINAEAHRFAVSVHVKKRAISRGLNMKKKQV